MIEQLKKQGVSSTLLDEVIAFKKQYGLEDSLKNRIPNLEFLYLGPEVWEMAISAILEGSHILLTGPKATGKNVLSDNLSTLFARPQWNMSLHINMDSSNLLGTDTFQDGAVVFRPGPIYSTAEYGGFGILDEINMAKNESLSVIHSALDYRRIIDVPGYHSISLHEATRFIATMNYGYAGTRELNDALLSRFLIIEMPSISEEHLYQILKDRFSLTDQGLYLFTQLFLDLQDKSLNSEISSKPIDLRGLLSAIGTIERGLNVHKALDMGLVNKTFDPYEKELIRDVVGTLFPKRISNDKLFVR